VSSARRIRGAGLAPVVLLLLGCAGQDDTDRRIEGGGVLAEGWSARLDDPGADLGQVRFVADRGGFAATNGPNVILWRPDQRAEDSYTLSCEVAHVDSHEHPHGAGLVFGGTELDGADPRYSYFLVHEAGQYLVKRRDGEETAALAPWTVHDAIQRRDGDRPARNRLEVAVDEATVAFRINGAEVFRTPRGTLHVDGIYGFRLVHNLDVRFEDLRLRAAQPGPSGGEGR
jgi:hypothetical protein